VASNPFTSGVFTINGAGVGMGGTADGFNFLYQPLSGDGAIVARLVSFSGYSAQAGLMIRETTSTNSKDCLLYYSTSTFISLDTRATTGGTMSELARTYASSTLPYWVKLVRAGSGFTTYTSLDGMNWQQLGTTQSITMNQNVDIGIGVSSNDTTATAAAVFDNVSVTSAAAPAPSITTVSATTGSIGSQAVLTGSSFGSTQGSSLVVLAGATLTINSWTDTSITVTIPTGATSGPLAVEVAPSFNASNPISFAVTSTPLPASWLDQDIGLVGVAGQANYSNDVFTVQGAGNNLGGTTDAFHFVYQPLSGDGTLVARIVSLVGYSAEAGIMVRDTLDPSAANACLCYTPGILILYERATTGAMAGEVNRSYNNAPYWMKLVRSGTSITGYVSSNGSSWSEIGYSKTVNVGQTVYVGLATMTGTAGSLVSGVFDNVSLTSAVHPVQTPVITGVSATTGAVGSQITITGSNFGSSQGTSVALLNYTPLTVNSWSATSITVTLPSGATSGYLEILLAPTMNASNTVTFTVTSQALPSGWLDQDVGTVGDPGTASYSGGVFTVNGSGSGLTGTTDSFHFVYQPMVNDGTITARVATLANSYGAQAGVMLRETLDPFSTNVSSFLYTYGSSSYGFMFSRIMPGGGTAQSPGVYTTAPYWVRAVRSVNTFACYESTDGTTWTQIGTTQTFTTAQTVYVGFGVSAGSTSPGTVAATFDNVSISLGSVLPDPVITGLSANSGAPGKSITILGSGFGTTQGASTALFNGAVAQVTSWADTQIVATVPSVASTGPVAVQTGNITGQGPTFTVVFTSTLTDSQGHQTTYTSQLFGNQWLFTNAQGSGCSSCSDRGNIVNQYDSLGNTLWSADPLGYTKINRYDGSNNLTSQIVNLNQTTPVQTTYSYNTLGQVLYVTDAMSNTTSNVYDTHGNLTSVTTPAGHQTQFGYNALGQLTTITDPLSHVTTLTYNSVGLIATITDAQSNVTTYGYDAHGNRTSILDALSHQTTFAYDAGDRLTTITYPDTTTTTFGYDYRGRRITVTDQNGKMTTYAYDDADRLTSVTDANNNVTTYGYDTESNLTSIQDANSHTTYFTYDAYGRVTGTNFPSTLSETYSYDANNNLTSKTDRNGHTITYVYDALNRLSKKQYPDSTEVDYIYDLVGKIQQVNDPTGTYAFAYDNDGRLTGTTTDYSFLPGRSFTTAYGYDAASNRTSFTDPESGSTTYAYDALNRLQTLTPPTVFTTGSFGFTYDALGRRTQMTRPNNVTTNYTYDNESRLLSTLHQLSGSTIDGAAYTLDNAGNRTAKTDERTNVTSNYAYDSIYQLKSAMQGATTTESYTYDAVGNRLTDLGSTSWSYNTSNELNATPSVTYTFDSNGNTKTQVTSAGTTTYNWDFENRLISAVLPGTAGTVTFQYDPFGRRVYKSSSSATSVFAYDGNELLEETNSSGSVVARYAQDLAIDAPLAMLRGSATSFYQADGVGSVTSLSNGAGALSQTYTFDSFGNQTASSGSFTNPFRYTAREFDTETSFYFNRARYYDPASGRFINEDLIGFGGGGNFYRYVHNDPTGLTDPMGLSPADVQRIKAACTKCTQGLTDAGFRRSGSGAWQGFLNDQLTYWNRLRKTHLQGCKSQAALAKPCLENPVPPYDNGWTFSEAPWWLGSHTVVRGESTDPNDPVVICDPWRNYTWTTPRAPGVPILPPM
jgi:RHS repeat-associated protein